MDDRHAIRKTYGITPIGTRDDLILAESTTKSVRGGDHPDGIGTMKPATRAGEDKHSELAVGRSARMKLNEGLGQAGQRPLDEARNRTLNRRKARACDNDAKVTFRHVTFKDR